MVEVRLFGSFRRYAKDKKGLRMEAADLCDVLKDLPVERGEVGLVLINRRPVESVWKGPHQLNDGDLIEIYPIATGG